MDGPPIKGYLPHVIRSVRLPPLPAALVRLLLFVLLAVVGSAFADEGLASMPAASPRSPATSVRAEEHGGYEAAWATVTETESESCAEDERPSGSDGLLLPAPTTPTRYEYVVGPVYLFVAPERLPVEVAERAPVPPVVRATPARGPPAAA